ncbi:uncharacterized protein C8Q71DRAFT_448146 [Rhodofomes roseus]|uniref:Uncharacterized protein n=1 Tax=Rhodofomes roseus TaxID=34475 RepID=A0ABQ8JXW9_9APHY|nr:uncharacterized protein C8Q71DRAFT_448146 [Rhodofomes roseus]KAH9829087.1 hypothetical protein C8Q71DRAFT_448146 [Rhodofomes roseus]
MRSLYYRAHPSTISDDIVGYRPRVLRIEFVAKWDSTLTPGLLVFVPCAPSILSESKWFVNVMDGVTHVNIQWIPPNYDRRHMTGFDHAAQETHLQDMATEDFAATGRMGELDPRRDKYKCVRYRVLLFQYHAYKQSTVFVLRRRIPLHSSRACRRCGQRVAYGCGPGRRIPPYMSLILRTDDLLRLTDGQLTLSVSPLVKRR